MYGGISFGCHGRIILDYKAEAGKLLEQGERNTGREMQNKRIAFPFLLWHDKK